MIPALLAAVMLAAPARGAAGAPGAAAPPLTGNDELRLELATGEVVHGHYLDLEGPDLLLSGDNRVVRVPLDLVRAAELRGEPLPLEDLRARVAAVRAARIAVFEDPPPHPPPALAGALSAVLPAAGHAALGSWGTAAGYLAVEGVIVGVGAWSLGNGQLAPLLPLVVLDGVFHVYAVQETSREARRRRAFLRRAALDRAIAEPATERSEAARGHPDAPRGGVGRRVGRSGRAPRAERVAPVKDSGRQGPRPAVPGPHGPNRYAVADTSGQLEGGPSVDTEPSR